MATRKKIMKRKTKSLKEQLADQAVAGMNTPALKKLVSRNLDDAIDRAMNGMNYDLREPIKIRLRRVALELVKSGVFDDRIEAAAKKIIEQMLKDILED